MSAIDDRASHSTFQEQVSISRPANKGKENGISLISDNAKTKANNTTNYKTPDLKTTATLGQIPINVSLNSIREASIPNMILPSIR